jgi:hypothetical protein
MFEKQQSLRKGFLFKLNDDLGRISTHLRFFNRFLQVWS